LLRVLKSGIKKNIHEPSSFQPQRRGKYYSWGVDNLLGAINFSPVITITKITRYLAVLTAALVLSANVGRAGKSACGGSELTCKGKDCPPEKSGGKETKSETGKTESGAKETHEQEVQGNLDNAAKANDFVTSKRENNWIAEHGLGNSKSSGSSKGEGSHASSSL
jgi:hypothetical protein